VLGEQALAVGAQLVREGAPWLRGRVSARPSASRRARWAMFTGTKRSRQ